MANNHFNFANKFIDILTGESSWRKSRQFNLKDATWVESGSLKALVTPNGVRIYKRRRGVTYIPIFREFLTLKQLLRDGCQEDLALKILEEFERREKMQKPRITSYIKNYKVTYDPESGSVLLKDLKSKIIVGEGRWNPKTKVLVQTHQDNVSHIFEELRSTIKRTLKYTVHVN